MKCKKDEYEYNVESRWKQEGAYRLKDQQRKYKLLAYAPKLTQMMIESVFIEAPSSSHRTDFLSLKD
ncbi:hypothetical protein [Alkalihalobacillus sp. AL-G]|uniref:hypothetical protein n=1 Tax=Alkalihalobacillus sp. AL-G TaxID=2926399 RepID=UPI00272BE9FA|nr:hypothetical protein [Alkalihalobacillus sp. AL-G]WLD92258.1 hypothetical protein MOJ78_14680 [Alkalihalobacillus sp. AL-G]